MNTVLKIMLISLFSISAIFFGVQVSTADENLNTEYEYFDYDKEINSLVEIDFIPSGTMVASWYGPDFHGKQTANTEIYNQLAYTAAHKSLPFGTMLRVTNPRNGKQVIVRINDRGPYIDGRDLDLSKGAAIAVGMIEKGVIRVEVEKLVPKVAAG